jgi:hypothetical protein
VAKRGELAADAEDERLVRKKSDIAWPTIEKRRGGSAARGGGACDGGDGAAGAVLSAISTRAAASASARKRGPMAENLPLASGHGAFMYGLCQLAAAA